jgi:hypothetical protein
LHFPLQVSNILYKFTFSCKTNPISKNAEMTVTSVHTIGYENTRPSDHVKANPKQTQTNPKQSQFPKNPKIDPSSFIRRAYARKPLSPEIRANPNKPNRTQPVVSLSNLLIMAVHKGREGIEEVLRVVWAGGLLFARERPSLRQQTSRWPSGGSKTADSAKALVLTLQGFSSGLTASEDSIRGRETARTSAMATQMPLATASETLTPTRTTTIVSICHALSFARAAQCPMA